MLKIFELRKFLVLLIGAIALFTVSSCTTTCQVARKNKPVDRWILMGTIKKTGELLYLNPKYVRYDKKAKVFKAILKEAPSRKEQQLIKEKFNKINKETEKKFNTVLKNRGKLLHSLIEANTGYYIVTSKCKNNKFTIFYPGFKEVVTAKDNLSKNIYNFICNNAKR